MSKRQDEQLLCDIEEALRRILAYTKGLDYQRFIKDFKTQDAVVRNLEIIGEASKGVSKSLKERHGQIKWSDLAKMRDKLIHHYFGVNIDVVWNIVEKFLPEVLFQIQRIIHKK